MLSSRTSVSSTAQCLAAKRPGGPHGRAGRRVSWESMLGCGGTRPMWAHEAARGAPHASMQIYSSPGAQNSELESSDTHFSDCAKQAGHLACNSTMIGR